LPANQQEVVRLKFQNSLSYKEISAITGLSVTNVGYLLHTAIQTLRGKLN
jgi:RNA polymerase sigma-70 factor (ECF subfamily)